MHCLWLYCISMCHCVPSDVNRLLPLRRLLLPKQDLHPCQGDALTLPSAAGSVGAETLQACTDQQGFPLAMFSCWCLACFGAPVLLRSNLLCVSADAAG